MIESGGFIGASPPLSDVVERSARVQRQFSTAATSITNGESDRAATSLDGDGNGNGDADAKVSDVMQQAAVDSGGIPVYGGKVVALAFDMKCHARGTRGLCRANDEGSVMMWRCKFGGLLWWQSRGAGLRHEMSCSSGQRALSCQ
eukprot:s4215_g7.t1